MTQTTQNATIFQGEKKSIVFSFPTGTDLSNATAEYGVFQTFELSPKIRKTSGAAEITIDDGADTVTVDLLKADSSEMEGDYYHELNMFDVSQNPIVSAVGILTIEGRAIRT